MGVPWETVREDYLLSNKYRKDEVNKRLDQLQRMAALKRKWFLWWRPWPF